VLCIGPNVDGLYIPELPARSLAQGKVDKAVSVIVAHTSDEGLLFTNPGVQDDAGFKNFFQSFMPNVPATKINTLASQVYPPNFSGSQPYTTQTERLKLAIGEALIDCNAFGLHTAFGNATRGYLFDVCPGLHAQDVPYAFFNGETSDFLGLLINAGVAGTLQDWIVDFTLLGAESGSSVTQLPLYGSTGQVLQVPTFSSVQDPARNQRCHFWLNDLTA
jgi:carboxylesterase type B